MSHTRTVDLNADVGEATEENDLASEHALIGLVTSVNVACGGHAGDQASMSATVATALDAGVRIGAHPSYPDRAGFGRRPMQMSAAELRMAVGDQLHALVRVCDAAGTVVESVKPHGALYEEVAKGGVAYQATRDAMRENCGPRTALVLPSGCPAVATAMRDMPVREEGFCDRAYRQDGGLVDRATPGAVLADPAAAASQALSLARGAVCTSNGCVLALWVDTLCIHGDSPRAVEIAKAVRDALTDAGIAVSAQTWP